MKRAALPIVVLACAALVWAACNRRHQGEPFLPSSPDFSGALVLSVSASSIPADGISRVQITAQITGAADTDKRRVRFTTTDGDFPGTNGASLGQTRDADVDSTGAVTVDLRSSTLPVTATVTAQVLDTSDEANLVVIESLITRITVDFVAPDPGGILRLTASHASGEADGASVVFFHADVSGSVPLADRSVTFTTTLGEFVSGTLSNNNQQTVIAADIGLRATATLRSPGEVGRANITATAANTTRELQFQFFPARPDSIVVQLGHGKLERGGTEQTTVTVTLSRREGRGTVTEGTKVRYAAFEKAYGQPLDLLFQNETVSDANGTSTAQVLLGPVVFVGTAVIRASVGETRGEADIEIDAPAP